MENKENRELYSIYLELGHEVFDDKIKKPMELYLHANSNVISMNLLNTFVTNAMETSKLGEVSFYENDLFSSLALKKKICSDDTLSPICGNSNDTCDILNPHTESIPFKIPIKIVERVMNNCYFGDGIVHPGDHLLFIHELCELFKCAGISMDQVKRKLFSLSLKDKSMEWYELLDDPHHVEWKELEYLFYSKFYPPHEIHKDRNYI